MTMIGPWHDPFARASDGPDEEAAGGCAHCGEDDFSPNVEAFELCGEAVCDECAEAVFEDNSQFGVGA